MARPRLVHRLDEGSPLTVLRAPLGFGKTTLVAQWWLATPTREPHDVAAWVTVDPDRADTSGFWQTVLDVLIEAGLQPPAPQPAWSTRLRVGRAIAAAGRDVTLVVDAFDRVTDDGIDDALLDLVRAHPNLRLVVCLRSHRRFPPQSYLDLDFTVIPARDLLFSVEETAALLDEFGVGDLTDERVRSLHAEVGGWVEPVRAFAIARTGPAAAANQPSDEDLATQVALSCLRERILPAIDGQGAELALATSLVDGFSTDFAALLADEPAAKIRLRSLHADGVLYTSVEDGETVYRWPPAARRAMAAELEERSPERVRQLHARIAGLYATHHRPELALRHALAAGDGALAVQIIEGNWRVLLVSHPDVLYAALSATPLELIAASPRALAVRDLRLRAPDDRILALVPGLPPDVETLRQLGASPQAAETLDTGLAMVTALRRRGLFRQAGDYCDRLETVASTAAVNRTSDVAGELPGLWFQLGVTRLLADDVERANRPLRTAYETAANAPLGYVESDAAAKLALASVVGGDAPEATVWLERHARAPEETGWFRRWIDSTVDSVRILIALDRLDIDEATAISAATLAEVGTDELWAFAAYAQALVALHSRDALGGLHRLDQSRSAYPAWHGPGSTARILLAAVEADLLLALGRANQARAALTAVGSDHPYVRATTARLELLAGHPQVALTLAADIAWVRRAGRRVQLEMLLIKTVAHHRLGNTRAAADALLRALAAARATGSLRPFTSVPRAELLAVAEHLPADTTSLLETPALRRRASPFPDHVELIELTGREQAVLERLAQGLLVHEIAGHLYVSESTIKTHLKALYRKLGATSRRQAVDRGRQLGMLASL